MATIYKDFCFHLSNEVALELKVFIDHLDVTALPPHLRDHAEDLLISVRLTDGGLPFVSAVRATRTPTISGACLIFGEWLTLPVKIRDLPKTAQLVIELWDVGMQLVGGTTTRVFDYRMRLKRGVQKLVVWPARQSFVGLEAASEGTEVLLAGGVPAALATATAARCAVAADAAPPAAIPLVRSDVDFHLIKVCEAYELAETPQTTWLDRLAFAQVRRELAAVRRQRWLGGARRSASVPSRRAATAPADAPRRGGGRPSDAGLPPADGEAEPLHLYVHMPCFAYPVVFEDVVYTAPIARPGVPPPVLPKPLQQLADGAASLGAAGGSGGGSAGAGAGSGPATARGAAAPAPGGTTASVTAVADAIAVPAVLPELALSGASTSGAGAAPSAVRGFAYWNDFGSLSLLPDPEAELENPVEAQYFRLARTLMRNVVDTNLKPNRGESQRIQAVIAAPSLDAKLSPEVKELLWKYRYSLTTNKKALIKFLFAVEWEDDEDTREAVRLLGKWAPIDTEDALRLLSHDFRARAVREHAVNALRRATDEDLVLFLLQLVQALRYEPDLVTKVRRGPAAAAPAAGAGGTVSAGSPAIGGAAGAGARGAGAGPATPAASAAAPVTSPADTYARATPYELSPLADFLIERAVASLELANFLNWYLTVELEDARVGPVFSLVHTEFLGALQRSPRGGAILETIGMQSSFVQQLAAAITEATRTGGSSVPAKVERLNAFLSPTGSYRELCSLAAPVAMPLNPAILAMGVVPKGCRMFKSALYPTVVTLSVAPESHIPWTADPVTTTQGLRIHRPVVERARAVRDAVLGPAAAAASTPASASSAGGSSAAPGAAGASVAALSSGGGEEAAAREVSAAVADLAASLSTPVATYKVIFKNGDDMRQDQLIIQMIRLMDQQLQRVGLDLRLTPYRVLATSTATGMMEMVLDSQPVSEVLARYNYNIMALFREEHSRPDAEYGIDPEVMDTYVKSCAGYCVITYLLGIGDRHLDNIMLSRHGHLFHIDFGYIFGRDPKPFPPPMRLIKEMIDAMGGPESLNYRRFRSYSCQAYNTLRKSANLVLCLLNLMRDAGIKALAEAPEVTMAKLQDKFRLDVDDEMADQIFLKLLDESVAALAPAFFEWIHQLRVAMR